MNPARHHALALLLLVCLGLTGCDSTAGAGQADGDGTAGSSANDGALATRVLATIAVKGRSAATGYGRDKFGVAWKDTDHNGCDQRNDVLRRDLTGEKFRSGHCVVVSGLLRDRYTGTTIRFTKAKASLVQIDHVVALENAWVTGAFAWSTAKRTELATDPLNLLAADGSSNESKGSGDAATWLPPAKGFRCDYVARQIAVKSKYGAWMTAAEKKAISGVLSSCPGERVPTAASSAITAGPATAGASADGASGDGSSTDGAVGDGAAGADADADADAGAGGAVSGPAGTGTVTPPGTAGRATATAGPGASSHASPEGTPDATGDNAVRTPGAFCSPVGAKGEDSAGHGLTCKVTGDDDRARWRS